MRFSVLAFVACAPSSAPSSSFESVDVYSSGPSPRFVLSDVDGDGRKDLLASFAGPDPGIAIRHASTTGSFGNAERTIVGSVTYAVRGSDLVVGDGQHIGLLSNGRGPIRLLGVSREAVLGANDDGVLTTDGRDLMIHSWDVPIARPLEIAPLVPLDFADVDGDGRGDLVGTALGHAAIRHGMIDGFGPVHLLGEMDGMTLADVDGDGTSDIVAWSKGRAFAWNGHGRVVGAYTVPVGIVALAAGDLDGRRAIVWATHDRVEIVGRGPLDGLWTNVRQLAIDRGRIFVADDGFIAVVRPSEVRSPW